MAENRVFTCPECNFVFKKRSHLVRHKLVHTNDRPFICNDCNKSFRTQFHLNRHVATHSGVKSFKCEYDECKVSCITEWNLKRHIKRTHMGKFKCSKCGQEFRKNKLLQQHHSKEHKNNIICCKFPGCAQIFSIPSKMRQHLKIHTEKGYICPVKDCSMKFNLWSECCLHAAECKKKEVSCDVCGKVFRERSNLKAHRKIHSEKREVFQCTYEGCGRFYTKQYNLKVHVQSFHLNLRPYVCTKEDCNKRFNFQHLLRKHYESVHDKRSSSDDSSEKFEKKKKKRTTRINTPNVSSSISGYIPELWTRMTPNEIKSYVDGDKCVTESDDSSSESIPIAPPPVETFDGNDVGEMPSEEESTDDTVPVHSSEEYETVTQLVEIKPFMYKPVLVRRPVNKSNTPLSSFSNATSSFSNVTSSFSNATSSFSNTSNSCDANSKWESDECMVIGESSAAHLKEHSEASHENDKLKSVQDCMEEFSDRFRNMFEKSATMPSNFNIQQLCRIQSINESDSSDSESQNKRVPCVI